jgi:hypothetical protein
LFGINSMPQFILNRYAHCFIFALLATIVFSFGFAATADAAAITWDGGGDGTTWTSKNNWSDDAIPGDDDDITLSGGITVQLPSSTTINSLTISGSSTLTFTYDAMDAENEGASPAALIIDAGNLQIDVGSKINHSAGTTVVVGSIYIDVQAGTALINGDIDADESGYIYDEGPGQGTNATGFSSGGGHGVMRILMMIQETKVALATATLPLLRL